MRDAFGVPAAVVAAGMLLAHTALVDRLAACALALVADHLSRRDPLVAVAIGVGAMMAIAAVRG